MSRILGIVLELVFSPSYLANESCLFLHGAALEKNGKVFLIIAPTQKGKSTVTSLLVMNGYHYMSDDVIPIRKSDYSVLSFPKTICVREEKILSDFNLELDTYFCRPKITIETIDNVKKGIEQRQPYIPYNSVSTMLKLTPDVYDVIFLHRSAEKLEDGYELEKLMPYKGALELVCNLRNPEQITDLRRICGDLIKKVHFFSLKYNDGYNYLQAFEELSNDK